MSRRASNNNDDSSCSERVSGAEHVPMTSSVMSEDDVSNHVDADCACGCQLSQPVGQIIVAANHSCFPTTRPVTWHIVADTGRVVQLTYRLLAGGHRAHDHVDPARSTTRILLLSSSSPSSAMCFANKADQL